MKKLSNLLANRPTLLAQAHLANLAFAYQTLGTFAARLARASLTGRVVLRQIDPEAERYWPALTALDGSQSVIDEHFVDEDLLVLADVVAFTLGSNSTETTFRLDDITGVYLVQLRAALERAGVAIDERAQREVAH